MVLCHCAVVSDRTVRAAIADGADDVTEVARSCGAGGACGGCLPGVEELLAEAAAAIADPDVVRLRQASRRGRTELSPMAASA